MQVPLVAALHMNIDSERVSLRIHLIRLRRIIEFLEDLTGPNAPPFMLDGNECWGMVVGLEEVGAVHVGGQVGARRVGRLGRSRAVVSQESELNGDRKVDGEGCNEERGLLVGIGLGLTTTVPFPHLPFQ